MYRGGTPLPPDLLEQGGAGARAALPCIHGGHEGLCRDVDGVRKGEEEGGPAKGRTDGWHLLKRFSRRRHTPGGRGEYYITNQM